MNALRDLTPLQILYSAAVAVIAGCVVLILLRLTNLLISGADPGQVMQVHAQILFIWLLPGLLTLIGAGYFLRRNVTPSQLYRFATIGAAVWTAWTTWMLFTS